MQYILIMFSPMSALPSQTTQAIVKGTDKSTSKALLLRKIHISLSMEKLGWCLTMFLTLTVLGTGKYTPRCQRRHLSTKPATSPFFYNVDLSV